MTRTGTATIVVGVAKPTDVAATAARQAVWNTAGGRPEEAARAAAARVHGTALSRPAAAA